MTFIVLSWYGWRNTEIETSILLLVFTDLDGTLLDHHSYDWRPASQALELLKRKQIPLIPISSKTTAEILCLRQELQLESPFVAENGCVIGCPVNNDLQYQQFGKDRKTIQHILNQIRQDQGYCFQTFAELGAEAIAKDSGLSIENARLANQRQMSEPVLWQDSEQNKAAFMQLLSQHELLTQTGGRYLSVQGKTTKAEALLWLKQWYQDKAHQPVQTLALGDSPNDAEMLSVADIAVVVRTIDGYRITIDHPQLQYTDETGPLGWNHTLISIIQQIL